MPRQTVRRLRSVLTCGVTALTLAVLTAGVAVAPAADAADRSASPQATSWSRTPVTPPPARYGKVTGLSCTQGNAFCLGVGRAIGPAGFGVGYAIARRSGGTWHAMPPVPSPKRAVGVDLGRVSCSSRTMCMAVGTYEVGFLDLSTDYPFAAVWDGRAWSLTHIPGKNGRVRTRGKLYDVSCAPNGSCLAVGWQRYLDNPLVVHWNGHSWTSVRPKVPLRGHLRGVSCPAARLCFAVGDRTHGTEGSLVERWNGSRLSKVESAGNHSPGARRQLGAVWCVDRRHCTALGQKVVEQTARVLVTTLDLHGWHSATGVVIPRTQRHHLAALGCRSARYCVGVFPGVGRPLAVTIDGPKIGAGRLYAGSGTSAATSVSCAAPHVACSVLATHTPPRSRVKATSVIVGYPKPGTRLALPRAIGPSDAGLSGVSCVSGGTCFAVGDSTGRSLILRTSGAGWTVAPSPRLTGIPNLHDYRLDDVSCTGPSACTAVGVYVTHGRPYWTAHSFAETWNGTTWTIVRVPGPDPARYYDSELRSVSCAAADDCLAIGKKLPTHDSGGDGTPQPLLESWDGTTWSVRPNPRDVREYDDVSCPAGGTCTVLAMANGGPVVLRRSGAGWTRQAPSVPQGGALIAISCTAAGFCLIVGDAGPSRWLAETSAGAGQPWVVSSDTGFGTLVSVGCVTSSRCAAVGRKTVDRLTPYDISRTLVETYSGGTWTRQSSPTPTYGRDSLDDVSCAADGGCAGVGNYDADIATPLAVRGTV